jgi:hypothetical protein
MAVSQLPQAPYRQDRKIFPTPIVGDVLFSEVRDANRTNLPEYGTPHPNTTKWPNHKLVFIKPVDIERNEIFEFFYAADRENQDLYNFSVGYRNIIGNVGGREFRVIQRSYVTPREGFEPLDIAFGAPMPNIPEGKFDGVDYIFFDRQQQRIEQQELDSLYVAEVHTYVETAFLEYKLSYTAQRTDPIPEKFKVLIPEKTTEELVEGMASMPSLASEQLAIKEDQLNPDIKLVRVTTRDSTISASLGGKQVTNDLQVADVTETIVPDGTTITTSALTVDGSVESLGNGQSVQRVITSPELFTAKSFSVERPDVVPDKFRVAVPTSTTEERIAGVADTPDLVESELAATEQQENVHVKRVRKTKRDPVSLPVSLTQKATANNKQLATVTETYKVGDTTETPSATVDIESQALGDGTYVVTKTEVPEVFDERVFGVEISDPLPDRFRSAVPTTTTEVTVAGTAVAPTLTGSEISATEQQVNKFVKRTRKVSRAAQTSGVTLNGVNLDPATGRSVESDEIVYPRGASVNGFGAVENIFANPNHPFWGQQADGSYFIGEQISENWFLVKKQFVAPTNAVNSLSNQAKKRFLQRVTPLGTDILFYEVGAMPTTTPTYGSAHYDIANWPNHKLIYIVPEGDSGILYRFYYAADRNNQDLYNFVDEEGRALTRTYIIPRAQYLNRASYNATIPTVGTSPDPQFGSSDAVYGGFVFVGENIEKAPEPLDNLYVVIERVYLPKVRTSIKYDDNIEKSVSVTQTVIKKGTGPTVQNSIGVTVQVENVNNWYDIETVSRIVGLESMFDSDGKFIPIRLPDVPKDVNYNFPNKLNSVDIKFVSATTINPNSGSSSTDTAYYIDYDIQSPPSGPYSSKIIRFLTDDPQAIRAQYPVVQLHPKRETIGIATAIDGNANAQQIELPPSIHGPIDITINSNDVDLSGFRYSVTDDLTTSDDFFTLMAGGDFVAGYEVSKTILNLYEVSVILINIDGLYTNKFVTSTTGQTRTRHVVNTPINIELTETVTDFIQSSIYYQTAVYHMSLSPVTVTFTSPYGEETITYPASIIAIARYTFKGGGNAIVPYREYAQQIYDYNRRLFTNVPAIFIASKLQKNKNLNPYFIFDSDGASVQATSVKSPAPTFGMTSSTGGNSVQVDITV